MQSNTLPRWEFKGKIYVKDIRKNSCRIRIHPNKLKIRIRSEKIIPDPQHCFQSTSGIVE